MEKYKGWIASLVAALFFFYVAILMFMYNSLSQLMMDRFDITPLELGYLSASYLLANVIFLFPAGLILDKQPVKNTLLVAIASATVLIVFISFTTDYYTLLLINFMLGLCGSFSFIGSVKIASMWFAGKKFGLITAIITNFAMLGGIIAQTPLVLLTETFGWRGSFLSIAMMGVIISLLMLTFISTPQHHKQTNVQTHQSNLFLLIREVIRNKNNLLAGGYTAIMNLPISILAAEWATLYISKTRNIEFDDASIISMMIFAGYMIGAPLLGWISDKNDKKVIMTVSAMALLMVILSLIYLNHISLVVIYLLFLCLGLFSGAQTIGYAVTAETNDKNVIATALSLTAIMVMALGVIIQPLFGYFITIGSDSASQHEAIYAAENYHHGMMLLQGLFIFVFFIIYKMHIKKRGRKCIS